MNIDSIRILGYDYEVILSDELAIDEDKSGECSTTFQRITIDSNMLEQKQQSTLLHEVIEALEYHLSIGLEHNQIELLEAGLYQVIRDNPHINGFQEVACHAEKKTKKRKNNKR